LVAKNFGDTVNAGGFVFKSVLGAGFPGTTATVGASAAEAACTCFLACWTVVMRQSRRRIMDPMRTAGADNDKDDDNVRSWENAPLWQYASMACALSERLIHIHPGA